MPDPLLIESLVTAVIAGQVPDFYPRAVAQAAVDGMFDLFEGLEALARIKARRATPREPGKPRPSPRDRPWQDTGSAYTPELSRNVTVNVGNTAHRLMSLIAGLAGRARCIKTLTVSLAEMLGVTRRCLQYARAALVAAGFIEHTWDRRTGIVTLTVLPAAYPPQREPSPPAPWPVPPTPSTKWGEKFRAQCARIRRAGRSRLADPMGGAQSRAPINKPED